MDNPEWGAQQANIFHEDALAPVEVHQLRTQKVLCHEGAYGVTLSLLIIHRLSVLTAFQQTRTCIFVLLAGHALLPTELWLSAPRPPGVVRTAAINSALAGDGEVCSLKGIDTWRKIETGESFPCCLDNRVEFRLEDEQKHSTLFDMQIDVALQLDSTSLEGLSCRDDDASATLLRTFVYSLLNGFLVLGSSSRCLCTKLGDVIVAAVDYRALYALLYLSVELLVPFATCCWEYQQQEHNGQKKSKS